MFQIKIYLDIIKLKLSKVQNIVFWLKIAPSGYSFHKGAWTSNSCAILQFEAYKINQRGKHGVHRAISGLSNHLIRSGNVEVKVCSVYQIDP